MRGIDHLHVRRSSLPGKLPEQVFPDAAPCPAHETVADRRWRAILGRAITPAAAALEHMNDPTDHAPIVHSLNAPHIPRQIGFDPPPLLVAQPKQVPAHAPNPLPKANQQRIVGAARLMSSDILIVPRPR